MNRHRTVLGVALALEDMFADKGRGCIISCSRRPGAVKRLIATRRTCERVATGIEGGDTTEVIIISSAGYGPENPGKKNSQRQVSLADQLARWCRERGMLAQANSIQINPVSWGTASEIAAAIAYGINERGLKQDDGEVFLVTATNPAHWLRVWITCRKLKPRAWKLKVGITLHRFTFRSRLREVFATIGVLAGRMTTRIQQEADKG